MAFELASLGIQIFINRWSTSKKKIKEMINEYLKAAAKDKIIQNTDVIIIMDSIFQMIKITENLNKAIKKSDSRVEKLIETAKKYIQLLKKITEKLPYENLNNLLQLQGTVTEVSFGKIEIKSEQEEISLVCVFIADVLISWIYDIFLPLEYLEINYKICLEGIKFLTTAKKILSKKRSMNQDLRKFINIYLIIYKSTAQYFLCRVKLKSMIGITKDLDSIANGFNFVVRSIEKILDIEEHKLNPQYIESSKIIFEHSTALLCEVNAIKYIIRGLKSFKKLGELCETSNEQTQWRYDEWRSLLRILESDWGLRRFEESDIDYSIGDSVNLFYRTISNFDGEIDSIKPFEF